MYRYVLDGFHKRAALSSGTTNSLISLMEMKCFVISRNIIFKHSDEFRRQMVIDAMLTPHVYEPHYTRWFIYDRDKL